MSEGILANRAAGWIEIFGRLKPGVAPDQAAADLNGIARQLADEHPITNEGRTLHVEPGLGWYPEDRAEVSGLLGLLAAAVGLLGLITCANLAGLFTVRAAGRRREFAVRLAIGADRGRVIRMLLAEGILISAAAAAVGLLLSGWTAELMSFMRPSSSARHLHVVADGKVLVFALAAATVGVLLFAMFPAMRAIPRDLVTPLKNGSAGAGLRPSVLRAILIAAQVSASFVLLAAAGLLVRDMQLLLSADPGYETRNLAMGSIDLTLHRIPDARGRAIYRALIERLPAIPGAVSATLATTVPPEEYPGRVSIFHPGEEPPPEVLMGREFQLGLRVDINRVGPRFFDTMAIRLLRGRDFLPGDGLGTPPVAIVNQALAERMWPGANPIGQRLAWPEWTGVRRPPLEVIGLAADTRSRALSAPAVPLLYVPVLQYYDGRTRLLVRTASDPAGTIVGIGRTLRGVDRDIALFRPETMAGHVADSLWAQRIAMDSIAAFGLMALLLSAIGLYGAMAQSVSQRRREVGIRMALGAAPGAVARLVLKQAMKLALIGAAAGLPAALLSARLLHRRLAQLNPADPLSYVAAAVLLCAVLLAASWIPARRASRVDPTESLRAE